ncbi:competence protein CoiA family protein [Actinoplanes subglobosus]|uniref:Competence protein CoiA family protein n=1 Tax=Actinoplanes subglobosus TaxID=1547892 RepID=A0ABV8ILI5_9ACTN
MPLVALGLGGLIDATRADLGVGVAWESIYRVRPRVALNCDACGESMHAKVSTLGLRFFAHDAARPDCPLTGETANHRLLKSAIAAAVRQAGWIAALEAKGPQSRWRADVLATSPDGARRVAWEAQLARQHDDDTLSRTERYAGDGVEVVWVFDRPTGSAAPAVTVQIEQTSIHVAGPLARLHIERCDPRSCSRYLDLPVPPPCPGHERWETVTFGLDAFVAFVCQAAAVWVRLPAGATIRQSPRIGSAARWWWTSPAYLQWAEAVREAQRATDAEVVGERSALEQARQVAQQHRAQEAERHARRIAALMSRQDRLTPLVIQRVAAEAGTRPWHLPADFEHAMGVSVIANHRVVAVVCPIASRITGEVADRLLSVTVYVASERERRAVAAGCHSEQRIVVPTTGDSP